MNKLLTQAGDSAEINPKRAMAIALSGIQLAEQLELKKGLAWGLSIEGTIYTQTGDVKKAMERYTQSLQISTEYHYPQTESNTLLNMGNLFAKMGVYDKAFELYTKGLKIKEELKDTLSIARTYENIGNCLGLMKFYAESNKNYSRAIEWYKIMHLTVPEANAYENVANNYIGQRNYPEALRYIREAIRVNNGQDSAIIYSAYLAFGTCYQHIKNDSALYYYLKFRDFVYRQESADDKVVILGNIGSVYEEKGDLRQAESYYREALGIAGRISSRRYIYLLNDELATVYSKKRDFEKAYQYQAKARDAYDSLIGEEKVQALAGQNAKYEIKQAESEIKTLKKENDVQKLRIQRKNILGYSGLGAAVLFLVIGFLLVRHNRVKTYHERLELEQKQLLAQINPHFIFNCLNSIQQFVVQNDTKNANKYLADFALLMRQTLENSKDGVIRLRSELEYLQNYLSFESMRFENKFTYTLSCAADVDIDTVKIPSMIIQPFVENAIRHGLYHLRNRAGFLKIHFYREDDHLVCEVDDNGIGMEQSRKIKDQMLIKYESHGMELTRKRLELVSKMNKEDYKILVINKSDAGQHAEGTTIVIKFSLQT